MSFFPNLDFESHFWHQNPQLRLAGVDEVGRGCLAGPVVAAAVIFPSSHKPLPKLRDSKLLTPLQRQKLEVSIKTKALAYAVKFISVAVINRRNILQASLIAMQRAISSIEPVDHAFIDGPHVPHISTLAKAQLTPVIHGDRHCYSIAAASILAKVARDRHMVKLHSRFPHYGWDQNKGYGTPVHLQSLRDHGSTPHHRVLFIRHLTKAHP